MNGNKIPSRTFGVELEIAGLSEEQAFLVLRLAGLPVEDPSGGRRGGRMTMWRFHADCSIEDDQAGSDRARRTVEVVSPILTGAAGLKQVRTACAALAKAGAYTNTTTGLHVHVGARDLSPNDLVTIVTRYSKYESFFDSLMHPTRRGDENEYCGTVREVVEALDLTKHRENMLTEIQRTEAMLANPSVHCLECRDRAYRSRPAIRSEDCPGCRRLIQNLNHRIAYYRAQIRDKFTSVSQVIERAGQNRYKHVNLDAYNRHGTVEFRQHHGSLDGKKVTYWIRLVLAFVETSRGLSGDNPARIKVPSRKFEAQKKVWEALKAAGETGLTKAQIIEAAGGTWTIVRPNLQRMRQRYNMTIEEFRSPDLDLRWRLVTPGVRPQPITRDNGPMMGLPKRIKDHFLGRQKIKSNRFQDWA